jgi:hypothetical protein
MIGVEVPVKTLVRTLRYCPRCRATTDHVEEPRPLPPWRRGWLSPLLWLVGRIIDPPVCLPCLRDDLAADDPPEDQPW